MDLVRSFWPLPQVKEQLVHSCQALSTHFWGGLMEHWEATGSPGLGLHGDISFRELSSQRLPLPWACTLIVRVRS
jgi:hypothetical protein